MRTTTHSISRQRVMKYLCLFTILLSSIMVYGQDLLPTIVPNTNRGLPFLYALPDNGTDLFSVAPDPTANPTPTPSIQSTDRTFDGEGSGFRATDRLVYAYDNDNDLYSVNPSNGNSTLLVNDMFTGVVQGVEFYLNNVTGDEVMFVIVDPSGDGNGGTKLYAYNPNDNWAVYAGYPKTLTGGTKRADGIAWNPDTGDFYVQTDDDVDFYIIDVTTGNTTFAFSTEFAVDGEGIGFAADGKLYTESDRNGERVIYQVDITNGDLTEAAQLPGDDDVEGIMGNVGARDDGGDLPSSYGWAAHQLPVLESTPVTVYLGNNAPDSEDPFSMVGNGSGDDINGIDDEDGVMKDGSALDNQILYRGNTVTLNITTNGNGVLNAWIDWDADGEFDSGDQIATNVSPSGGSINLNVPVPSNAELGTTYARFRYSSETNLLPALTEANDGEVEDYQVNIGVYTELAVIKTGVFNDENGDNMGQPGETITYTFDFKNLGDQKIKDITLTDNLPGITISGGTFDLNAGQEKLGENTATYTITQADIDARKVINQATATGEGYNDGLMYSDLSDFGDYNMDRPTEVILATQPGVALIKTGVFNDDNGNGSAEVGETISYTFEVSNTGNSTLTDLVINDPLVQVNGSLASLAPLQSDNTTFTATYAITQDDINNGFVENQATIESCVPYQVVDPEGCCDGKVINLTLEYLGSTNNVNVRIESDNQVLYDDFVNQGDQFYIEGTDPDGTFPNNNLEIFVDNVEVGDIHVSCSQPIGPGLIVANLFEVIAGESRNGGPLCPLEGQPGYVTFPPDGCCDGGVTQLTFEYTGANSANVRIENDGEVLYDDDVVNGAFISVSGTDNDGTFGNNTVYLFVDNVEVGDVHVSCSQPIGPGVTVAGLFEVISGESKDGGELCPVSGSGCLTYHDLSDDNSFTEDDPTIVPLPFDFTPTPRGCNCAPFYKDSNFENPQLISGNDLEEGAVYRFSNVFPANPHGTTLDALVKIEEFSGGASLLEIDVTSSGLNEAFQPRINSTNSTDQSVRFSITFVQSGGNYGDEEFISLYGTPLDIDGDGQNTREYAELNLPDAYFVNSNTLLNIITSPTKVRGEATLVTTAPGGDVSLDPRFTYSNYWENISSIEYTIGKVDGNSDRYYSLNLSCAEYDDPETVLFTYPAICGNVSDEGGNPLVGVDVDITGSDGSAMTVQTDSNGNYEAVAEIPANMVDVVYEIRENDPVGYISISDVDGANDNLITRTISVKSSCGNDFVDGVEGPNGWAFECGDDKLVDEYGYNANCNITTVANIPDPANVYQYVVEIVYKGNNPGQTLDVVDSGGTTHTIPRSVPVGTSSNIWVYRGLIAGNTSSITYTTTESLKCKLQSVVLYAFRNVPNASSSSGVFTSRSGVNDIQVITIDVPAFNEPRNLIIETPISELTDDGRYLLLTAEAGGVSEQVFIYGPDSTLPGGSCCLAIPSLTLVAVPGAATQVTITVDTRNNQNGQSVNGQSWVIASGVNVDGDCFRNTTDAINDINNTFTDIPVAGNVLTNDEDPQGDNQTVTTTGNIPTTAGGNAVMNADGSYVYTPPAGYSGPDTFQYSIVDDGLPPATDTATVFIEVLPLMQNTTIANADTAGTEVNVPVSGNVLVNDFDPEGDNQVVTNVGTFPTTQGGSITIDANGNFTYTPPLDFEGEDTFEYFIEDDNIMQATDSAILTITVNGDPNMNRTYANDDAYNGNQGATITGNVLDNDSDPEGDTQMVDTTITPVSGPSNGILTINADGTFSYVPNDPNFFGTDQFVYEIFDNGTPEARDQATVFITLSGINTTDAVNDINNTFTDIPVAGNVLTNDEDDQGDNQIVTTTGIIPTTAGGNAVMNADGSYVYTPPAGYSGPDTFQYSIEDDGNPQATDSATVFIEVLPIGQNTTIANADTAGTEVNVPVSGNVLANDFDPEGDNQVVTNPGTFPTTQGGTITILPDGSFTYTPPLDFEGEDTFEYFIADDNPMQATDSAILTITVNGDPNRNRTYANDDAYNGNQGATITGNVLDNDTDPEGDIQMVDTTVTPVSGPSSGVLTINANGTFSYVPNDPNFFGTDQFVYEIFDDGTPVARDRATVIITVFGQNKILAVDDINNTYVDLPVSGSVATNDENPDGPAGTEVFTVVGGGPSNGTLAFNPDGSYTYTPDPGFTGEDTFEYQVCDGGNPQACDTATVYIEVLPLSGPDNEPPVANADTNTTEVDTPVSGNVLPNDFDPDGDPIVVTSNTQPVNGSVTVNPDGSYTYTPDPGFEGEDTFEYTICDNGTPALCDTATVTIQVIPNNGNITTANDDAYYGEVDMAVTGNVLDNDQDVEGDTQMVDTTVTPVSGPSNGTLAINADGSFTYTPNAGFIGTDQFVYEIFDDGTPEARDRATVYILIEQTPNPDIQIVKSGLLNDQNQNQCTDPGETITYTFTVTNPGNVPLGSVVVTDPLLEAPNPVVPIVFVSGDTNNDGLLDITETWIYTADYAITQADIDAGQVNNQATATGTDADGNTVTDISNAVVTDLCQNPAIDILKTAMYDDGGDCSDPGELINYTFTVTNAGNVSLSNVVVNDPLLGGNVPGPDSGDTDNDGELDVTETWIYTGSYAITQADIDAGSVQNTATVTGTAPDQTTVTDTSNSVVTNLCQAANIAIVKTGVFVDGNGNQCADPGEMIDYTFTVTNEGNVSLASVTVTDLLLGGNVPGPDSGDTDNDGELDVTETWIFLGSYAITQADIDAGEVVNQATAEGTDPNGAIVSDLSDDNSVLEDDPTVVGLCQAASIALIKEGTLPPPSGGGCPTPGDVIEYSFTVVNTGNVTLTDITVTDMLVTVVGGPIDLAPGATDATTFTATYVLTQADIDAGFVENQAEVFGTTPTGGTVSDLSDDEVITEDNPTIVDLCQSPIIAIVKVGTVNDENGNKCADEGETISYEFTIFNLGNVTLHNIFVTDPMVNVQGGPISLGPLQTDNTSFSAIYTLTQADIDAGEVVNQATVTGTSQVGDTVSDISDESSEFGNDPTITDLCQEPVIALIKTGTPTDENGNGCVDLGETIVYDFVVTNVGNVLLTDVMVTDPMVNVVGGPISLAAGESDTETFSAVYTVVQDDVDAGLVSNQATAEGTDPNGTVVSDLSDDNSIFENDPTITVLCQDPGLSLEKTGVFNDENGDGIPNVGETISYLFMVTNIGNVTLYDITISDDLPGIIIEGGPIAVLQPGEVDDTTFTGTYAITQADIDAGEVVNQAVATGYDINGNEVTDLSDDPNDPTNFDANGDGEPDDPTVTILPNVLVEPPFEIFNGITPDGDGMNDFFRIVGIEEYPDNNMKIFNRWGVLVWETDGYGGSNGEENVFRGISDGRSTIRQGEMLPTGTYYYVLTILGEDNPGESSYAGYLYINR